MVCPRDGIPVTPMPRNDRPASAVTQAGQSERGGDDDRCDQVGQQLLEQDAPRRYTHHLGRLDELAFAQGQHLPTDESRQAHPAEDGQDHDQGDQLGLGEPVEVVSLPEALGDDRRHRQRAQQERERQEQVGDEHDDAVEPAAGEAGDQAEHDADTDAEHRRDGGDQEVGAQAVEQPGEVVDAGRRRQPQRVSRPEAVVRRTLERQAGVEVEHVAGLVGNRLGGRVDVHDLGDHRRQDGGQNHQETDERADDGDLVLAEPLERDLGGRTTCELLALGFLIAADLSLDFTQFGRTDAHARPLVCQEVRPWPLPSAIAAG